MKCKNILKGQYKQIVVDLTAAVSLKLATNLWILVEIKLSCLFVFFIGWSWWSQCTRTPCYRLRAFERSGLQPGCRLRQVQTLRILSELFSCLFEERVSLHFAYSCSGSTMVVWRNLRLPSHSRWPSQNKTKRLLYLFAQTDLRNPPVDHICSAFAWSNLFFFLIEWAKIDVINHSGSFPRCASVSPGEISGSYLSGCCGWKVQHIKLIFVSVLIGVSGFNLQLITRTSQELTIRRKRGSKIGSRWALVI